MREMTAGAFAAASRLSAKALRLYAESGLLAPARTDPFTGYRYYAPEQLARARLIGALRRIGMPLARVRLVAGAESADAVRELSAYWAGAEAEFTARRAMAGLLVDELSGRETVMWDVAEREMPDRTVLSAVLRTRDGEELSRWTGAMAGRLGGAGLPGLPGIEGAPFLVYHGEVGGDGDGEGPVEYCRPVPSEGAAAIAAGFPDLGLRTDPAHREAYVRLTRAELGPVSGERAFGTLLRWAAEHGETPSGPPRQVFFADPRTAAADAPVSDVIGPLAPRG